MNELKCYKLEVIQQQMPAGNAAGVAVGQRPATYQQAQMPFGAPQPQGGGETNDLPF